MQVKALLWALCIALFLVLLLQSQVCVCGCALPRLGLHVRGWTFLEGGKAAPSVPCTRLCHFPCSPESWVWFWLEQSLCRGYSCGELVGRPWFCPPSALDQGRIWREEGVQQAGFSALSLFFGWSKPYIWGWLFMRQTVFILAFLIYNLVYGSAASPLCCTNLFFLSLWPVLCSVMSKMLIKEVH